MVKNFKGTVPGIALQFLIAAICSFMCNEVQAQITLPNTEQGNVIIRPLDYVSIPGYSTIVGHVAVFENWQGANETNPADYPIVDTQCQADANCFLAILNPLHFGVAPDSVITERVFGNFVSFNNLLFVPAVEYGGGNTLSQAAGGVSVEQRRRIASIAHNLDQTVVSVDLLGFVKDPVSMTFRCDGFVEWVYEQAGVQGGQGLWPNSSESRLSIPSPAAYVGGANIVAESGSGPDVTDVKVEYPGDGTIRVTGEAFDRDFGSGIREVQAGFTQNGLFVAVTKQSFQADGSDGSDGRKRFSIPVSLSPYPAGIGDRGDGDVCAFDRAGNDTCVKISIDHTAPSVSAFNDNDTPIPGCTPDLSNLAECSTDSPTIIIHAHDLGSGLAEIDFPGFEPYLFDGSTAEESVEFVAVSPGVNTVQVIDKAGNVSYLNVNAGNVLPVLTIDGGISITAVAGNLPPASHVAPGSYSALAVDPTGAGFVSIQAPPDATCTPALPVPAGTTEVRCTFSAPNPGLYAFTVVNQKGSSAINWVEDVLSVSLSDNTSGALEGDKFHADVQLSVNSSAGISQIQSYDLATPDQVDTRTGTSFGDLPDMATGPRASHVRKYVVTDLDGNQAALYTHVEVGAGQWMFGVDATVPECMGYSDLKNSSVGTHSCSFTYNLVPMGMSNGNGILARAVIIGPWTDASTGETVNETYLAQGGGGGYAPLSDVPIQHSVNLGHISVDIEGNQAAETDAVLDDLGVHMPATFTNQIIPIDSAFHVRGKANISPAAVLPWECEQVNAQDPGHCDIGESWFPGAQMGVAVAELNVYGDYSSPIGPGYILPGSGQTVRLGFGMTLSGFNAVEAGAAAMAFNQTAIPTPLGWVDVNLSLSYMLTMSPRSFWNAPFTVTVPLMGSIPSSPGTSPAKVLFFPVDANGQFQTTSFEEHDATIAANQVSFTAAGPGYIKIAEPMYHVPVTHNLGGFSITSDGVGATLTEPPSDAGANQLMNVLASRGLTPLGPSVVAGPSGRSFNPPALVTYTPPAQGQPDALFMQTSLTDGTQTPLAGTRYDSRTNTYSGYVAQLHSMFNVFVPSPPVPAQDLLPPQTRLSVDGSSIVGSTATTANTASPIGFTVSDPSFPGAPVSGVAETYYLIDVPFVSTSVTTGIAASAAPVSLQPGVHTLAYYSVDVAGNVEPVTVSTLTVVASSQHVQNGLAIASDVGGALWTIASDNATVTLSHSDAAGVFQASTTLPGADASSPWSVIFDAAGSAYAVGTTASGTRGSDLSVYKASPAGDAVTSTIVFDSGYSNNEWVFGATSPGWMVGTVQTSGPVDLSAPGGRSFSMALWRLDATQGAVNLASTYSRAGFDAGTDVAADASGNLWVSGFSMSGSPRSPRAFDLALWKYSPDGRTLLAGPFIQEAFLGNIDDASQTRLLISSAAVHIAAPRSRVSGGTDLAMATFDLASQKFVSLNAWRASDGSSAFPSAVLTGPQGEILVAGGIEDSGGSTAALWRYAADGTPTSASQVDAGGARGAVLHGSQLWLSVDGSTAPYVVTSETALAGVPSDVKPPRTSLTMGTPSYTGDRAYVTSHTPLNFSTIDDKLSEGDGLGTGGGQTFHSVDGSAFVLSASSWTLSGEGTHAVSYYSVDAEGNAEVVRSTSVAVDATAPVVAVISSGTAYALSYQDPVSSGVASGIDWLFYLVDTDPQSCGDLSRIVIDTSTPHGTCTNPFYAGPFQLSPGEHAVLIVTADHVGNGQDVIISSRVVVASPGPAYALSPSSGPIGVSFSIAGTGFGTYAGSNTRVKIGLSTAPLSVWNDTTITGTIPGLSTGTYAVTLERQFVSSTAVTAIGNFQATALAPASVSASSGPIGIPFTITGASFGPYAGSLTRVLVGGATAPLSVWNDTTITGTIPGVAPGVQTLVIERAASGGGLMSAALEPFTVTVPVISTAVPTSGPIGNGFTLSGTSFGPYAGSLSQVLIGGATTPLSVWNDATIKGTVPGSLLPGTYPLLAQRRTSDGGLVLSNAVDFTVVAPFGAALSVSSGPIGVPFTITGSGFGTYSGANTLVLIGEMTAPLSVWNDTTITGTVPGLSTGTYPIIVERLQGGSVSSSTVGAFSVVAPTIFSLSPSSGPIGVSFSLAGSGFGVYSGGLSQVLIGGATAPLSVWNDASITGTIPGSVPTGVQPLFVQRRASGGGLSESATVYFQVTGMNLASINPSTGPIGIPFTITGTSFGAYAGSNTRVKFGGISASLSVWNDTTITGTIPTLTPGTYTVSMERQQGSNVALANLASFTVTDYSVAALTPLSGPIGVSFTLSGSGFGPYAGANSRVLIGGATAALSVWNDATITGTIPNVPSGSQPVWIERQSGTGVQSSATQYFQVTVPAVASLAPSSAPIGAPFTLTGTSFGAYAGANTRVKFGGIVAPLSVWNDGTITGAVPGALSTGPVTLLVERASGSGTVQSAPLDFLVLKPAISTITPAFGLAGTVVTLSGSGFGPYAGSLTKLLVGGTTVALSVWNDATIRWTVPSSLTNGVYAVTVVRNPSGGSISSDPASFTVGASMGISALTAATPLASQPDMNFEGGMNLPADEGGRIETAAKAAVSVPAGALDQDVVFTLARERTLHRAEREEALTSAKLAAAGEPIAFGPEGTRFNKPVTIELPYDPAGVPAGGLEALAVHYFNPVLKAWEALASRVDMIRHVVIAQTEHFSLYQVLLPGGFGVLAADASFGFKDMYAFPNPSRGGSVVTIRVQPGLADSLGVRVYDLSGRKVHSSSDFRDRGAYDDGNGKGAQYTYDHAWDVSGIASGVYTYVVHAQKAGQADIRKTGRVGVIK